MFKFLSNLKPAGDQPRAIKQLVGGLKKGLKHQVLLGVTGSGKTFTVAKVIEKTNRPTLVITHNKTLAAQTCNELRDFFGENHVYYFVSYYDYYQPEAYIPSSDTYIGKEAMINDEIDRLRHAATTALLTKQDVIVVASVSCIYSLGDPDLYRQNLIHLRTGDWIDRSELQRALIRSRYTRTNSDLKRASFRLRGDNWEVMPPNEEAIYRFETKNGLIGQIFKVDPVKGFQAGKTPAVSEMVLAPARHFVTHRPGIESALKHIAEELAERLKFFEREGKYLEAERLERRTKTDMEMIKEIGYCHGIENYSRHLSGRLPGAPPTTLLDYFPDNFLTVIDESHVTIPQLKGMYEGDHARKKTLIEYGFRLPSAIDNRPLTFEEFKARVNQVLYASATPGPYELKLATNPKLGQVVEQIIRPTGLIDPKITIRPATGQVDDLIKRIKRTVKKGDRVLVTTLTKKMAEDLSEHLKSFNLKVNYLHSDVKTLDRIKILTNLRKGVYEIIVGVNLLREGLDLPEVSLVGILDADKEGFLRSETSLIQVIGRAARNAQGEVIIYADKLTQSIKKAVGETERRRRKQIAYNKKHGITPQTIIKKISDIVPAEADKLLAMELKAIPASRQALLNLIRQKEAEMRTAAKNLDFELAAILRDEIKVLKSKVKKPSMSKAANR